MADEPSNWRGALYLRKSRADLDAEAHGAGETLAKHRRALLELAERHQVQVVAIREEIVSGEHLADRPEMQQLLREVREKEYDAVLCMDIDRLGRGDMIDQGTIMAAFKKSFTRIITPRKAYNLSDEMDEEWSEFEAFMARRELKLITKRLQRGRIMAVKEGKYIGAHPPFGYDRSPGQVLVPNQDAGIVRMIFHWYVHGDCGEQLGSTRIANHLNEMGISSPLRHGPWEPSTVLAILNNEVYLGRIQWGKYGLDHENQLRPRPRQDWIDVQGRHQPLVTSELFAAARKIRQSRGIVPTARAPRNPLAGLVTCGSCGRRMILQTGRCGRVKMCKCVTPGCNNKSSSFHLVEERLLQSLAAVIDGELEKLGTPVNNFTQNAAPSDNVSARSSVTIADTTYINTPGNPIATAVHVPAYPLKHLKQQLARLEKRQTRIHDLLESGCYDIPTYQERSRILKEKISATKETDQKLHQELNRARSALPSALPSPFQLLTFYRAITEIPLKNSLLKTLVARVVYFKVKSARGDNFTLDVYLLI